MADRTWNAVDSRLYEEDWTQAAIIIMGIIIAKCPNQYGVYKLPLGFIRRFLQGVFVPEQPSIDAAIKEIAKEKAIKLYDDRVVWIVKKWGRDKYSQIENNRKGAIDYLVANFPNVVADFETKYPIKATKPLKRGTSDADADADADSDSDSDAEPEVSKKTHKTVKPDLPEWCINLVKELFPDLKTPEIAKQAEAIEQLFRLDSYTQEDIDQVLHWARADTGSGDWPGWSVQFLSCAPLRNKKQGNASKFAKMKAAYEASKEKGGKRFQFD